MAIKFLHVLFLVTFRASLLVGAANAEERLVRRDEVKEVDDKGVIRHHLPSNSLQPIEEQAIRLPKVTRYSKERSAHLSLESQQLHDEHPHLTMAGFWGPEDSLVAFRLPDVETASLVAFDPQMSKRTTSNTIVVESKHEAQSMIHIWLALLFVPALIWASTSPLVGAKLLVPLYMTASIGMNILNKEAAVTFKATFLLVIIQMLVADVIIVAMEFRKISCGRWQDMVKWSFVPVCFAGMLSTSMWAFRETTLSAILILKNFLPCISFVGEKFAFNTPEEVKSSMFVSLSITFVGTLIYGYVDASVSTLGLCLIIANCFFSMGDRMLQTYFLKIRRHEFTLSVPFCMLFNNTVGAAIIFGLAVRSHEISTWRSIIASAGPLTWFWVIMSSGCGACLSYVGLRLQQVVSGTTVLVLQNLNKILLLLLGSIMMGDHLRSTALAGCIISMSGAMWYTYLRLPVEVKEAPKA